MILVTTATNSLNASDDLEGQTEDAEATVRIANPDAENGYNEESGPLDWLNSARITTDPDDDAVHCVISVGDPRGGFCFTVRRLPSGEIILHMPHPGEGMAHMTTKEIHPGTLQIVHDDGTTPAIFDRNPTRDEDTDADEE